MWHVQGASPLEVPNLIWQENVFGAISVRHNIVKDGNLSGMAACQDFLQTLDQSDEEEHVDEELRMITITIDGDENGGDGDGDDVGDDGGCDDDGDGSFGRMTRRLLHASGLLIRSGEFEFGF